MTGKRSRGWSLQERAFAPAPEAQACYSGRGSGSHFGSDAPQPSSAQRDVALQRPAKLQQHEPLEAEAGMACNGEAASTAKLPRHCDLQPEQQRLPPQQDAWRERQLDAGSAAPVTPQRCQSTQLQPLQEHEQRQSRQHLHHQQSVQHQQQPPSTQPQACQQKAILPGVLASLVQTQRSSQRPYPTVPQRPPLGPSAPSRCRRDANAAAADSISDRTVASQPCCPSSSLQSKTAQMLPPSQWPQQQGHAGQQQQPHSSQQQRSSHGARMPPRNLSVQIPVANLVHMQLYSFFSRRRRQLQQLGQRPSRYTRPSQAGPRNGLLALPEDVLLKVICTLRHQEIGNLFGVCKELRATMDTAMMLHFNVLTPHHDQPSEAGGAHDFPPRPTKRGGSSAPSSDPASTTDHRDAQPARRTRPRALLFQDESECSVEASAGADSDNDVSSQEGDGHPLCTPLTPISIAS